MTGNPTLLKSTPCGKVKTSLFFARQLCVALISMHLGCDDRALPAGESPAAQRNAASASAGMIKYPYLAADGGPHMLLPSGEAGVDYSRACAITANTQMAMMPLGSVSAMVFADPPMTSWGMSADGLVEVYYLKSWTGMNLDALITKATASMSTGAMTDSGQVFHLSEPDALLLFAGDTPISNAYAVHRVKIPAGSYKVLTGIYSVSGESVTIYRLQPVDAK